MGIHEDDMPPKKGLVISVSGKGGVGKTTLTALTVRLLSEAKQGSLLVIDANPDSNLADVLGVPYTKTVGMSATQLKKQVEKGEIPPEVTKRDLLEARVFEILVENPGFDLLVMGRPEGEGCYCLVNNLLTHIIDTLIKNYDYVVMDMEAGLEHLSRRTDRDVDTMIIVTDTSHMGLQTAKRIKELAKEVHIQLKKIYLVGNRFPQDMEHILREEAQKIGVEYAGIIPFDENVMRFNLTAQPLLKLPEDSPALGQLRTILTKIQLLNTTN
jgi:CO dehydrogenase maturation factor